MVSVELPLCLGPRMGENIVAERAEGRGSGAVVEVHAEWSTMISES